MKQRKPVFELLCLIYALVGSVIQVCVLTQLDYIPDILRGGELGGQIIGFSMLAGFVGSIAFVVNIIKKVRWLVWYRATTVLALFVMMLFISSRM